MEGEISAVDARASTLTVTSHGKTGTYRVRPDSEVTLNGGKSKFAALAPKMTVRVTAFDPTVAARVEAADAPAAPAPAADGTPLSGPERRAAAFGTKMKPGSLEDGPEAPLTAELADSQWRLNDGKVITLHANGTAEGNWPGSQGNWKAIGPDSIEWTLSPKAPRPSKVDFDKNLNNATWKDEFGQSKTARKVARSL